MRSNTEEGRGVELDRIEAIEANNPGRLFAEYVNDAPDKGECDVELPELYRRVFN